MKEFTGKFFVLEGIECSGKSIQAQLLYDEFSKIYGKENVILTKEPGGKTTIGKTIREFLLEGIYTKNNVEKLVHKIQDNLPAFAVSALIFCLNYLRLPEAKINWEIINALLFIFDRAAHIEEIIRPALENEEIVICDRFDGSTIAYQGYGENLINNDEWDRLLVYNAQAKQNICPDLNILLDIPVETAIERLKTRGKALTNFEKKGKEYFLKIRAGFLKQAKNDPEHWVIIDGEQNVEKIHEEILRVLKSKKII